VLVVGGVALPFFFLQALRAIAFLFLRLPWIAGGLWSKPQAEHLKL
jgi:hypothetical protein